MTHRHPLHLEWAEREGSSCLKISGWTQAEISALHGLDAGDFGQRLALFPSEVLAGGRGRTVPPVAGRFILDGEAVIFIPRFPFVDGAGYSLLVDLGEGDTLEVCAILRPPKPVSPTTEVLEIYPTAPTLPVNLLRIYVHFSAPMSEGWAGRAVRVCHGSSGAPLEDVFLPPEPELWDPQRRRLTMLLDPGRIKRGLVPNLEMGYPLVEEEPVKVIVSSEFQDAVGQPLKDSLERHYQVGPALRSRIDPSLWRLVPPPGGSRQPLVVSFDRPLDHGLLLHSVWIQNPDGEPVPGTALAGKAERSWQFTPSASWERGEYQLIIEPHLEDVAGNSPVRVFDRDVSKPEDSPVKEERLTVGFSCGSGPSSPA